MDIREKLIQLRSERHLSQQDLADLLDVSRTTVSRWESGRNIPSTTQLLNICKVLGIDSSEFIEGSLAPAEAPAAESAETKEPAGTETDGSVDEPAKKQRPQYFGAIITLGVLAVIAVAGLIITIVYAVKDSKYDTSTTVWITSMPQNTPMIVLCIFLVIFLVVIGILMYLLFRRRK
ncbi:MAG: helix-turn-helix domain-containing protein [Clostridia bacterium]|nr:helix-turn-helix domain-containing protein [Clostridia bacterium]